MTSSNDSMTPCCGWRLRWTRSRRRSRGVVEAELSHADLEEELAVMQDDRSRLALELDAALAQESALEKARDEVLTRLDRTSDGIRAVLGDDAPAED